MVKGVAVFVLWICLIGFEVRATPEQDRCADPVIRATARDLLGLIARREAIAGDPEQAVLVASLDPVIRQRRVELRAALGLSSDDMDRWLERLMAEGLPPETTPPPPVRVAEAEPVLPPTDVAPEVAPPPPPPPVPPPPPPPPPPPSSTGSPALTYPGVYVIEGPPVYRWRR